MQRTICSSMSSTKASSSADDWGGLSPLGASSPMVVVDVGAMVVCVWFFAMFCNESEMSLGAYFLAFSFTNSAVSVLLPGRLPKNA